RNDGFSEDDLKKVHSPIGLPIKSNTPEEIAISIAAEIIQVKNSVGKN
ncbi:MAG: XdhC family protein, partial [Bacteroidetes bacterium]|nr:XdhC family protein [Bacteroidota bacterium]